MNPITERRINFLHWHRDGGLIAPVEFSAGTPYEDITTWRERVAANGGTTVEVYNPTPPPSEEQPTTSGWRV
ncbi:hypothetical protein GCM10020000_85040 [Streptomyces olivoverticillatus]